MVLPTPVDVLAANPVSLIAQKLLIQKYRSPDKRAQDVLYIHDTIELFGANLATLKEIWTDALRPAIGGPASRKVLTVADETFSRVTDLIRDAARMPQDRALSPERLRASCELGLRLILT